MGAVLQGCWSASTFAAAFIESDSCLAHGVTVAQQILVLFVRVRILVGQQRASFR